jgi:hypothetical protein
MMDLTGLLAYTTCQVQDITLTMQNPVMHLTGLDSALQTPLVQR